MSVAVVKQEVGGVACSPWDPGCIISINTDWVDNWQTDTTTSKNYSCRFLSYVDAEVLNLVYYDDYDEAYETVRHAKNWALIHFPPNYTEALIERLTNFGGTVMAEVSGVGESKEVSEDVLFESTIHIYLDMTNQQVNTSRLYSFFRRHAAGGVLGKILIFLMGNIKN